jgi:hypothetical protein
MAKEDFTEQQLHHETEMLTRRLPIARAALEKIAKGQWAPEILKIARDALNTLETLNALDALKVFYRKMSAQEYEHSVAQRRMAIARTALETTADGGTDPGVRELARETLDGFSVLSDGERFKGFFLGVQQDQPIPEVDATELKRFHENMSERSREAGPGVAIGLGALAPSTSGVDTGPLCVRNWLLGIMFMQGLLADWQQGTELDGSVYRVAATIPLNGVQFDPEAFATRLRAERSA